MFCDICDEFDRHETEDCPIQASDSPTHEVATAAAVHPTGKKERVLPPPRKYCDSCEGECLLSKSHESLIKTNSIFLSVFGHEQGECDNDEY